jgi:type I restriction enzyme S subunit
MEGFKNTDVGIIPNDWNLVSFDDTFDFYTTATYSRAQLSDNEEIGYVHYGDIHVKCLHFLDLDKITLPTIKNELLKNYPTIKDGDVIVVDASEDYEGVGKCVEVKNLKNKKVISGLHTFLLRDKEGKIADGFKGYIHSNKLVKKQMDTLATGLKVYGVSKNNLKKILIPLPPTKAEQTAIATALNDADALIQKLEQLIAKKRLIKQGAMQKCLNPDFYDLGDDLDLTEDDTQKSQNQTNQKNHRSDKWVVKKLGEVLKVKHGKSQKEVASENGSYPILASGGIIGRAKSFLYNKPSVLIGRKGTIDKPQYMDKPFWSVDTLFYTEIFEENDAKFIYYMFNLIDWYSYNEASGVPSLNAKTIELIEKSFPKSKTEQTRIAQILSDMDNEIEALEKQLEKYKMLKQGMMQVLLTGKIRLNCDFLIK